MPQLAILRPPPSLRSGDDILGQKTVAGLTASGIPSTVHDLWPEWWVRHLWHSSLPGRRRLFEAIPARLGLRLLKRQLDDSGAVWVNGCALPIAEKCAFEKSRIEAGQDYIFHLQDDWFSLPPAKTRAENCANLARLVVVPTVELQHRVQAVVPHARVVTLEEPIDVDRFGEDPADPRQQPFLAWAGNPNNLKELPGITDLLASLYKRTRFSLRVICGSKPRALTLPIPWDWYPYDPLTEGRYLRGAAAGLAPMKDSPYARCKGSYKVKTYLAAGIPAVASPVGHQASLIADSETGFLVDRESDWLDRLSALLSDSELRTAMGRKARRFAAANLSHSVLMPQWSEVLKREL